MKKKCPNCNSEDITVFASPTKSSTDFWDGAKCNNCGYPDFAKEKAKENREYLGPYMKPTSHT